MATVNICIDFGAQENEVSCCFQGSLRGSDGKESTCNLGDLGSIPGLGTFPGEGKDYLSSILVWRRISKSQTRLSDFHFTLFFMVQLSQLYMTTGKNIALTRQTFIGKLMSLLFNMFSRLVIAFLPRSKRLLISWLQSPSALILEPKKIKSVTVFHCFPIYLP